MEQAVDVGYYSREFYVDFLFVARGTVPVRIRNFSSSCPCTAVAMEKTIYYPGQKGIVTAVYKYAAQSEEPSVQTVEVLTDRSARAILLKIVPKRSGTGIWAERPDLRWIGGQDRAPLSFLVEIAPSLRDRTLLVALVGGDGDWRAQTEALTPPGRHRVTVTPVKVHPRAAALRLGLGAGTAETTAAASVATTTLRLLPNEPDPP